MIDKCGYYMYIDRNDLCFGLDLIGWFKILLDKCIINMYCLFLEVF